MNHVLPPSAQSSHGPAQAEKTPTPSADENAGSVPPGPSAYVPQFRASSALILSRIRSTKPKGHNKSSAALAESFSSGGGPRKDGRLVAASSSTVAFPIGAAAHESCHGTDLGDLIAAVSSTLKRKRSPGSEVPDFTQNTMPLPPGMSSSTRAFAAARLPKPGSSVSVQVADVSQEKGVPSAADEDVPTQSALWGFHAGEASDVERTQYFQQKNRTDLLKILSSCDQLHPQLLVDVLVSVSKRHADLPMFDSPDWQRYLHDPSSAQTESGKTDARPVGRQRHGHAVAAPKARQRQKNAKRALRRLMLAQNDDGAPPPAEGGGGDDDEGAEEEEEALPASWPKAGEGLYSKLPPETEDRAILADEGDGESFSQFMVDQTGKPIMVSACA